jgi:hypothetical protein
MKMFPIPIVLLFLFPISHALSCITEDTFTAPLDNFNIQSFAEELKDLEVDEDDTRDLCRIELFIDYSEQQLEVRFSPELENNELPDGQVRFDTLTVLTDDGSTVLVNILEYACSDEECDKEFAIKHISWLLNAQYPSLITKVRPLLLGNTKDAGKSLSIVLSKAQPNFCTALRIYESNCCNYYNSFTLTREGPEV